MERFTASHGPVAAGPVGGGLELVATDGCRALVVVLWPSGSVAGVGELAAIAAAPRTAGLLLVRRGGWAVGTARDGRVLASRTGTRYVQSRTAAGGWSQQRYARRRAGQAADLVEAARTGAASLIVDAPAPRPDALLVGGDRALVAAVLEDPRLAALAALPRSPLLDVPDPRRAVLDAAARRALAVRVRVDDPPDDPPDQPPHHPAGRPSSRRIETP